MNKQNSCDKRFLKNSRKKTRNLQTSYIDEAYFTTFCELFHTLNYKF